MRLKGFHKLSLFALIFILVVVTAYFLNLKIKDAGVSNESKNEKSVFATPEKVVSDKREFFSNFKSMNFSKTSPNDKCVHKDAVFQLEGFNSSNSTLRLGLDGGTLSINKAIITNMPEVEPTLTNKEFYYLYNSRCDDTDASYILPLRKATFVKVFDKLVFIKTTEGKDLALLYSDELPVYEPVKAGDLSNLNKLDSTKLKDLKSGDTFQYALIPNAETLSFGYKDNNGDSQIVDAYQSVYIFGIIVL
jgi:hypothetical protein